MTFSSVGYLNLANDNSGIFRTNVLREPEPEPEFDGTGPISFSPNLIRFTSNKQSQLAFIRLSEPVISPLDKDIGLTIKFTSNTSGISITPTEVYWSSVEDFQLIKTITVQVLTEINQDLNNFISIEVITNSELYKGLVPDFIVNYDNPNTEIRVRKEIHAMTVEQRTLFTQTYRQAWDAPESGLKDCADNYLTNFSRGLHNNGAFLPWHRGYLLQVENRLREISPNITIPYWDWSRSPRISQDSIWGAEPGQFSGNGGADGCVTDGPFGSESGFEMTNGGCLQRRITGGSAASATEVQNLLDRYPRASDYDLFRNRLEHGPGMHDSVHCLVGGTMCSARASNDPIFFLHHAMVDKIWSEWQAIVQEGRSAYTGDTSRDELMPGSPYTPGALLDMRRLPAAAAGGFVEVRYE
jgi:tyrosinase